LPDGDWTLAFRPHHLRLGAGAADALRFRVQVLATEITGSESFVHVGFGGVRWVLLAHGVHVIAPGTPLEVHVATAELLRFAVDGARVATREAA
jgi:glycerol transport system ATP-binding protein